MLFEFTAMDFAAVGLLGLLAGVLGGLLGVGGSVVMIPGLVMLLGRAHGVEQHIYQAAAMVANIAVSIPAAMRHRKAGMMSIAVLKGMLPAAAVCIVLGVTLSNLPVFSSQSGGVMLGRLLAVFLVYVIVVNVMKLRGGKPQTADGIDESRVQGANLTKGGAVVGTIMGTLAGLMGIGGGAIAVPLQQTLLKLPLRSCIANSSAVIAVSATIGAIYKNASLSQHATEALPLDWRAGALLGLTLAPTAWAGGRLGATLTHRLPLKAVRVAFIALMVVAAWKMAAIF